MKCAVCGKSSEETQLFDGVYDKGFAKVCFGCSQREGIILVKKPTQEQLAEAEKRKSVKELIANISSPQKKLMQKDQIIAHKDLAKLKFPTAKQEHSDLISNYDWVLKQARRHSKLSTKQVAEKIGFEQSQIESLENGQLFSGFEKVAYALENLLDVKVLKDREIPINLKTKDEVFQKKKEEVVNKEKQILDAVKKNMERHNFLVRNKSIEQIEMESERENSETIHDVIDLDLLKEEKMKKSQKLAADLESGRFDFSRRENLDKVTLQDLADLKKARENSKKQ